MKVFPRKQRRWRRGEDTLAEVLKNARLAAVLARAGYATTTAVAGAGDEQLLAIDGVSEKALRQIRERVPAVDCCPSCNKLNPE